MARQRIRDREPVEVTIEDLSHDGRGIARVGKKVLFVNGALPGERVIARYIGGTRQFDEARAETILEASPDRVEPRCEFYGVCNGCSMMHLAPEKQIAFKENTLRQNLSKIGHVEPVQWLPPLTDEQWHYRRRARLSVRYVKGKDRVLVGFREKNGRYVADMNYCHVLKSPLDTLIQPLSELIGSLRIRQHIAQIEASVGAEDTALIFRNLKPVNEADKARLLAFAETQDVRIFLQPKGPKTVHEITAGGKPLYFTFPDDDIRLEFEPADFIQVNEGMNRKMLQRVKELLAIQPSDRILDLFCGLGNFTLPLARHVASVTGVEGDEGLIERARRNASLNGLDNVDFHTADLTRDHSHSAWFKKDYSKVLIDPPRSGAWDVLPLIAQTGADTLVYVSCHPASLARDAGRLVNELGYELVSAGVMDMFPHTSHVESVALFHRKKGKK